MAKKYIDAIIPDDIVSIVKNADGGIQFEAKPKEPEKTKPGVVYPQTTKLEALRKAEMELGAARVAAAAERRKFNPSTPKKVEEVKAEGGNVPVFRPGDFREYAKNFKLQATARSKDM